MQQLVDKQKVISIVHQFVLVNLDLVVFLENSSLVIDLSPSLTVLLVTEPVIMRLFKQTGTALIDNTLNSAAGCCTSMEALTVESAGFNWRLPKTISLFLRSMDGYFEVEGGEGAGGMKSCVWCGYCTK